MNNLISSSIFSFTSQEYVSFICHYLQKGSRHALLLYQEWFRTGQFRGNQQDFQLAKDLFHSIQQLTQLDFPTLISNHHDGFTGKFLLKTEDSMEIESVLIPMKAGNTLCLSSQIGCRMGCAFCETGKMGLLRQLTVEEIVSQLFVARFVLKAHVRNLVFMGMGEPLDNYEAVVQAIRIFTDANGFGLGPQHLTISTSGCIPNIYRLMDENFPLPHLAISLTAATDELRNRLMPINRTYPLKELYQTIKDFNAKTNKPILIAYVLMKDQNDSLEHAQQLAHYLKGLNVKINLIPYNAQSRDRFQSSTPEVIGQFAAYLKQQNYFVLIRQTKGEKIMAACGQLGNLDLRKQLRKKASLSVLSNKN